MALRIFEELRNVRIEGIFCTVLIVCRSHLLSKPVKKRFLKVPYYYNNSVFCS